MFVECVFPLRLLGRALAAALILARLSSDIFIPFIGGTKVARRFSQAFRTISLRLKGASVMGDNSKIEWCDATFNPWMGCTKVGPACDGCYAEALMDTRYGKVHWGAGEARVRTSPSNWSQPLRWNRAAANLGRPVYVFCASLADVWDNEVDPVWRADLMHLIRGTPNLTWLLLSKRIGNATKMCASVPPNVALGATIVTQEEWDRDMPKLRAAASALVPRFTFASVEPMLGPIDVRGDLPGWVICGGESGSSARPMHPAWARGLRDQCAAAGTPFFMKQMSGTSKSRMPAIPDDLMVREFPNAAR